MQNNKITPNKKILFLDIEATNLSADIGYLLCIGYKWAGEKTAHCLRIDKTKEFKIKKTNDIGLLKQFEPIFNVAELVVYHFGDYYDLPFLQTRRLIKGLYPLPQVASVDTWRIAKKKLRFKSNRLENILESLGCPVKKTPVSGTHWIDAMCGDSKSINYVVDHCKRDVLVLEWVYDKLKTVWPHHPSMFIRSLKVTDRMCPLCGSENTKGHGIIRCVRQIKQRMACNDCHKTWYGGIIK